jgi:transposase InsO family protein
MTNASHDDRGDRFPTAKVTPDIEAQILKLRATRKLGAKRLCNQLLSLQDISLSPPTVQKVFNRHHQGKLIARPTWRKQPQCYNRPVPEDRVQVDVCKTAPDLYHYASVDDCSRYCVLGVYSRRTAVNTMLFLERVIEELPFPVQRIQTDRGREFFAIKVQTWLQQYCIKFRPIKPRSPHLNGKIERLHKTNLIKFYATQDLHDQG